MKELYYYLGNHKSKLKTAIILIFISVLLGIVPYFIIYRIISSLIGKPIGLNYYLVLAGISGITLLLKEFIYVVGLKYSHDCAFNVLMDMRKALAANIYAMPLGSIQEKGIGAYKKLFADDIDSVEGVLAHAVPEGIPYILQTIVVIIILTVVEWRMGLLVIVAIPFGMIPMILMVIKTSEKMKIFYKAERFMNKSIIEYIEGMEVIKAFNRINTSYKKYESAINDYKNNTLEMYSISWKYNALMFSFLPTTILFALPFGVLFVLNQTMDISVFILCLMLALSISPSLTKITEFLSSLSIINNKTEEFLEAVKAKTLETKDTGVWPVGHDVKFENVSFAYTNKYVANQVSFEAKANEVTAIVGKSGSGKSTLVKLLVRFWDIESGSIAIGDTDIREISQKDLMSLVSFVSQDTFLFDIPIIDNIRLGKPEASDEEVMKAAKAAGCHEFVMAMKKGYSTCPGEAGDRLSGGEKQRITIARAILKDAPIILLDEATASTDPENEDRIQEAINALIKDRTLIVIAHRLSTIVDADKILLVDEGKITGQGNHSELLESAPVYQELWTAHKKSLAWDISTKEASLC